MEGHFRFGIVSLSVIATLVMLFIPAIMWVSEMYAGAVIVGGIAFGLIFASLYIPGSYQADEEGVTFRILFWKRRIAYSDIRAVKTENREGGHERIGDGFTIITDLIITTSGGMYSFKSEEGSFSMNEQIRNPAQFKKQLDDLPFVQLGKFIQSHISAEVSVCKERSDIPANR